jgi:mono/diheme cytochrome c family protein
LAPIRHVTLAALLFGAASAQADDTELRKRGEYLLRAAGCVACHTDSEHNGQPLAGGRAFNTPQGVFYSPNITSHPEKGIGGWSEDDLARALTEGVSPEGHHYYPVFPYTSYTRMRREDIHALKTYLDSIAPVDQANRPHVLPWYLPRAAVWFWKMLYFNPGKFTPRKDRSAAWNRGAYLVESLAHCGECHSPRNRFGAIDTSWRLAGTSEGPDGETVPNITPDKETGIGRWSDADLAYYLRSGADPDGDYAGGLMGEVIDEGLSYLSEADAKAIVTYLKSLAPVEHRLKE